MTIADENHPLPRRSATDLAEIANREHFIAMEHARTSLDHGMACGAALLEARRLVPSGEWNSWCATHLTIARGSVGQLMRLARYREMVIAAGRTASMNDALMWLRGQHLPALNEAGGHNRVPTTSEQDEEMRRLRDSGVPVAEIARRFEVGEMVVRGRTDPKYMPAEKVRKADQRHRASRAATAKRDSQRDAMVSGGSGPLVEAYGHAREACNLVDCYVIEQEAPPVCPEREVAKFLRAAMRVLARMTAPQTFKGTVLRCECGFVAENVAALGTHTRRKHQRMPTVAERTPRTISPSAEQVAS